MSIRARVCADAIEAAGADRVITMDLHAPQVQGFFRVPVDDLYAAPVLCEAIASKALPDLVVVSPDAGFAKKARLYAKRLGAPLAIADKERADHTETAEVVDLIGDVEGRTALVVDDFTISAGHAGRRRPGAARAGRRRRLRRGDPRPAHRAGDRAPRRQRHRAPVHDRLGRDAAGGRLRAHRGRVGGRACSARRSAASPAARASACCSSTPWPSNCTPTSRSSLPCWARGRGPGPAATPPSSPFRYREEVDLRPRRQAVPRLPPGHRAARHRPARPRRGRLPPRGRDGNRVELVLAHPTGIAELAEGEVTVDGGPVSSCGWRRWRSPGRRPPRR